MTFGLLVIQAHPIVHAESKALGAILLESKVSFATIQRSLTALFDVEQRVKPRGFPRFGFAAYPERSLAMAFARFRQVAESSLTSSAAIDASLADDGLLP